MKNLLLILALCALACNDPNKRDHPDMNENLNERSPADDISGNEEGAFNADTTSSAGVNSNSNAADDSTPHLKK